MSEPGIPAVQAEASVDLGNTLLAVLGNIQSQEILLFFFFFLSCETKIKTKGSLGFGFEVRKQFHFRPNWY